MIGPPSDLEGGSGQLLAAVRQHAAVLGAFDPLKLVTQLNNERGLSSVPRDSVYEVLGHLSRECEEVPRNESNYWRLRPDPRSMILSELRQDDQLKLVAAKAQGYATDPFGTQLARAASGSSGWADLEEKGGLEELNALDSALSFLGETGRRSEVQAAIQREETDAAFRFILPGALIGREGELQDLADFVFDRAERIAPEIPSLFLLRGTGGAGKSALLAEFARRELEQGKAGTPVVWLDFDRPMLASTDPLQLMLDMLRQLSLFWPDLREALTRLRKELELQASSEFADGPSSERALSYAFSLWHEYLQPAMPVQRPVVLILDTFEEAILHGEWNADRILRWIDGLVYEGKMLNLRVILSGREFDAQWLEKIQPRVAGDILLKGLDPEPATQLLSAFLVMRNAPPESYRVAELVGRYGGNPLMLKILAQYLASAEPGADVELLAGNGSELLREELAQQFLYTRILSRIRTHDADMVKLAFPGLALRRMTADLVLQVLAKPCQIDPIDPQRAQQLLDALGSQVWLVQIDETSGVLHHRRDLRRLMLEAIPSDKKEILREIHSRAADYYRKGKDPQMVRAEQQIEAQYHELMAEKVPEELLEQQRAGKFLEAIGEDSVTLPSKVLAELRFTAGKQLTTSEATQLDGERQQEIEDEKAFAGSRSGYAEIEGSRKSSSARGRPNSAALDREVLIAFAHGNIKELSELVDVAFESDILDSRRRRARETIDVTETALWRASMGAIATGQISRVQAVLAEARTRPEREKWAYEPIDDSRKDGVAKGQLLAMISALVGNAELAGEFIGKRMRRNQKDIRSVGALRLLQLLPSNPNAGPIYVSLDLVRYLSTKSVFWLRQRFEETEMYTKEFIDWMERVQVADRQPLHSLQPFTNWTVVPDHNDRLIRHVTMPELYFPITQIGVQMSTELQLEIARQAAETAFAWPRELSEAELAINLQRDPKRWHATLVEFVDRSGQLDMLVETMAEEVPDCEGILKLLRAYRHSLTEAEKFALNQTGSS